MTRSKAAFLFATQTLGQQPLYLWTFTFRALLELKDTRKRWNHLLTLFRKTWPNAAGLRVFEMHKSHGLHVHLVTNRWIDVNVARSLAAQAGWGRIHVKRIPSEAAAYIGKYLGKERPECLRGWRLWAGFGNWQWTKVKDLVFESRFCRIYRACRDWLKWVGNRGFHTRMELVEFLEMRTVEEGWTDGCGPGGKPYADCALPELLGWFPSAAAN